MATMKRVSLLSILLALSPCLTHAQQSVAPTRGATQPANTIPHTFRITLALYQRSTGHYLWRGEITDLKPDADPLDATGPMIAKLVEALGKSVGPAQ